MIYDKRVASALEESAKKAGISLAGLKVFSVCLDQTWGDLSGYALVGPEALVERGIGDLLYMKLTKAQKLAQFDNLKAATEKLDLTLYDLVNSKFKSIGVRIWFRDYIPQAVGHIEMKVSLRAMPLFLVTDCSGSLKTPTVHTESEIEALYHDNQTSGRFWPKMLYHGMLELHAKYHSEHAA